MRVMRAAPRADDAARRAERVIGDVAKRGINGRSRAGAPTLRVFRHAERDEPQARALASIVGDPALLRVALQPIVDLRRGAVVGYEALARCGGADRVAPDLLFQAAERVGAAEWLEARAIRAALAARALLPPNCFLSLNVSPGRLGAPEVREALASAGSFAGVVLELTEHAEVADYGRLSGQLEPYRHAGALVAVDDTGAGYSSLQHLLALRPEFVKVDRSFVAGVDRDEARAALVEMLGRFAGQLDGWIVAEGIERAEELDALVRLRVPLGQGYLLGRPSPAYAELDPALARRIEGRAAAQDAPEGVAALLESAPAGRRANELRAIVLSDDAPSDVAVLLDESRRPMGLLGADRARRDEPVKPTVQRVKASTSAHDLARRAMARPASDRFDPLVCCDGHGRYVGIVRVERLVERLTDRLKDTRPEADSLSGNRPVSSHGRPTG